MRRPQRGEAATKSHAEDGRDFQILAQSRQAAEIAEDVSGKMTPCGGNFMVMILRYIHEKANSGGVEHTELGAAPVRENGAQGLCVVYRVGWYVFSRCMIL